MSHSRFLYDVICSSETFFPGMDILWHPLRNVRLENLENRLLCQMSTSLRANFRRDDDETQKDNKRIVLVPCIITGRAMDCIAYKLEQLAAQGRMTSWY